MGPFLRGQCQTFLDKDILTCFADLTASRFPAWGVPFFLSAKIILSHSSTFDAARLRFFVFPFVSAVFFLWQR